MFQDLKLDKRLLRALEERGFTQPTPIQAKVFSVVMSGADVCGIAQTGTGKTIAYLLPLLNQWKYDKLRDPQILVLVPTRELVLQVTEEVQQLCTYLGATVMGIWGGVNINTQKLQLEQGYDVLVATPGRFFDLAMAGAFKVRSVRKLVIDEVDEMLHLGFRAQLKNILDLLPPRRQNLLFSATLIEEVEALFDEYFGELKRVEAAPAGTPVEQVTQRAYEVPNFHTKVNLLKLLLKEDESMERVVVFTASRKMADTLHELIEPEFPGTVGLIHSNKEQNHRFNTVARFKDGTYRVLIATDIVARGIDITGVTHVVNFDLPELPEHYIHRIGRTGRAEERGTALTFVTGRDAETRSALEAFLGGPLQLLALPEGLEISEVLTDEEQPKVYMKELSAAPKKKEEGGAAFHEKSAKNQKVNKVISRKDRMMQKYGKPIKRGAKKKR
ncbi:DEAD/DEAH box helicase [Flaviaesturariibacter amylovorans]|uniref:DEAD/DEAH box helicase n=1 Tax=Flaviaesturariibacter amylovorans TaxID=1084520 RepID=A0ABP8GKJ4_9BACT